MTWSPIIRVFLAIEFDPVTQKALHDVIVSLKKNSKSRYIRWTKTEHFHITLKFISSLDTATLDKLETKIIEIAKKYSPLSLTIGHCIALPHFYLPRVIAMEVSPEESLKPLAGDMTEVCDSLLINRRDNMPFRPHVTMGRIKHPKDTFFNEMIKDVPTIAPFTVDHLTLFRSDPVDDGSHYTVLKRFPLN